MDNDEISIIYLKKRDLICVDSYADIARNIIPGTGYWKIDINLEIRRETMICVDNNPLVHVTVLELKTGDELEVIPLEGPMLMSNYVSKHRYLNTLYFVSTPSP